MKQIPDRREPFRPRRTDISRLERPGDKFTRPDVKYNYEKVSWEKYLSTNYTGYISKRSSFIPIVIKDGERQWLLGSFHDFPGDILMDFGGKCIVYDPPREYAHGRSQHLNYQHQFGCALMELYEESKGLLVQPVLHSLGTDKPIVYRGTHPYRKEDVWFVLVQIPYEKVVNILDEFTAAPYVHNEKLGPLGFYKEREILSKNFDHRTSSNLTDFVNYLKNEG